MLLVHFEGGRMQSSVDVIREPRKLLFANYI